MTLIIITVIKTLSDLNFITLTFDLIVILEKVSITLSLSFSKYALKIDTS